jgi:putative NIF3 family GTP cyclohydrolase 1 type 2
MKLSRLYERIIKFGGDRDPRRRIPRKNPFADTAILCGALSSEIRKILVGIDIDVADLLLADKIRQKDGLDLVLSHHPQGAGLAGLPAVMQLQVDVLSKLGVPPKLAQELLDERMREVSRRVSPANLQRVADAAKLLKLPFMCVHTPADNHVFSFLTALMQKGKPKRVRDIVDKLMDLPEYRYASRYGNGPEVILGEPSRRAGKIFVDMTGGTEGPKDVFDKLYKTGVRTLVCMHLSEEHFKKVKDTNLNVVIAGHIASDTLGLNLLLDRLEKEDHFSVLECSGFRRFKR